MNIVIPKPVNEVLFMINDKGYEAYVTGGAVRNNIMGYKVSSYDIITNGELNVIKNILKKYDTFYYGENNRHLGINNAKYPMIVTKYRTKENTLESDLATRDFTMNALAFSEDDGLIDYGTGVIDIQNKVIKANGLDDSVFLEDPIRILRAIRLSGEYGMRIDSETQIYMNDDRDLLKNIPVERIRNELSKILLIPRCDFYIRKYFDIFLEILPELALLENFNQQDSKHIYDALEHTFVSMKAIEPKLELRLTMLLHDIAKPFTYQRNSEGQVTYKDHAIKSANMAREILNRLKFSKKIIQKVTKLIEYHDIEVPTSDTALRHYINDLGIDNIEDLYYVKKANCYAKNPAYTTDLYRIEEDMARIKSALRKTSFIRKNELKLSGKELIDLGVEQSKVGKVIDILYYEIIAGKLKNNKEKLSDYVVNNVIDNDIEMFKDIVL